MADKIKINRAPVLTLWAAVVARRIGFDEDEALSLAKAVSAQGAHGKALGLGIHRDSGHVRTLSPGQEFWLHLCGYEVRATNTEQGVRAVSGGKIVQGEVVRRYLERRFGENLKAAREAMESLAQSIPPEQLARRALELYEQFRPAIPAGKRGWGAAGILDLREIESLTKAA